MRNENIVAIDLPNTSIGFTSAPIQLFFLSVIAIQVISTGTLAGRIEFSVSNDGKNWAASNSFPDLPLVVGGNAIFNGAQEAAYGYIRLILIRTNGSGGCRVIFNGKGG